MKNLVKYGSCTALMTILALPLSPATAAVLVQCPGDSDGDAVIDSPDPNHPNAKCMHISGSDGFANMADGYLQYIFGFGSLTGVPAEDAIDVGILNAEISSPTIQLNQGDEFFLSLTNTGMLMRPDLSDPHTVHFHGFPNASSIFDGVPDVSISINMGATLTYYYNIVEPGTYLYHCHVEAAEHMQMGMQGNLWVHPQQNQTYSQVPAYINGVPDPDGSGRSYTKFVYNDIDGGDAPGSTGYDVEYPLQLTGCDPDFHDASMNTQPLPFAEMRDRYHMFNGRGYPITLEDSNYYVVNPGEAQAAISELEYPPRPADQPFNSQPISSRIEATVGQKILLRITNLSITKFHTITVLGLPMKVVGRGGRELRDKYATSSVNLGGGEAYDVIVDTLGVEPGTYHVYITELNELSNNNEAFGGPMTEIVVAAQ